MMVPIRATFKRADKPGGRAEMVSAVYADVPMELLVGTLAQAAMDVAMHSGDEDCYLEIRHAIERAEADGKIMTMHD